MLTEKTLCVFLIVLFRLEMGYTIYELGSLPGGWVVVDSDWGLEAFLGSFEVVFVFALSDPEHCGVGLITGRLRGLILQNIVG